MLTKKYLLLKCYCFDTQQGAAVMGRLLRDGIQIRLLLDDT